jgi:hypothetical protein
LRLQCMQKEQEPWLASSLNLHFIFCFELGFLLMQVITVWNMEYLCVYLYVCVFGTFNNIEHQSSHTPQKTKLLNGLSIWRWSGFVVVSNPESYFATWNQLSIVFVRGKPLQRWHNLFMPPLQVVFELIEILLVMIFFKCQCV